jgi:DNA polymerase-3 subunit alpha
VFQLESRGMKELIARLRPDSFEDIIALVALFVPGRCSPAWSITSSIASTGAKKCPIRIPTTSTSPAADCAGAHLRHHPVPGAGDADCPGAGRLHARRCRPVAPRHGQEEARGDGQAALRLRRRRRGAGIDAGLATKIFDLVEKFAGYGFNKSHSAAYALVSYQTAWLKAITRPRSWPR